ncbi:MAG: YceI family protein [Bdellovibrionales bacterium]
MRLSRPYGILAAILLIPVPGAIQALPSLLAEGSHCVAYHAKKTVFFFFSGSSIVGRNCDISAQVLPEVGGLYHIEVNIPVRGFDSGEEELDEDVMELLRAKERPELTFRSKPRSAQAWRDLFAKGEFELDGELQIGTSPYPVKFKTQYVEREGVAEVDGVTSVRFSDFGIKPPSVMGGVWAKAQPDLELHFHLTSQRILGADSIRLSKSSSDVDSEQKGQQ